MLDVYLSIRAARRFIKTGIKENTTGIEIIISQVP